MLYDALVLPDPAWFGHNPPGSATLVTSHPSDRRNNEEQMQDRSHKTRWTSHLVVEVVELWCAMTHNPTPKYPNKSHPTNMEVKHGV